jgi:ketosteroid isomerase-like protein
MFTTSIVVLTTLLCGTATAHKDKAVGNAWDDATATALETKMKEMFVQLDAGNLDALLTWADDTTITWDVGPDGKGLAANTPAETAKLLKDFTGWMKESGTTVETNVRRNDCHATTDFGFCVMEFDQTISQPGQPAVDQSFRATMVARAVDGQWRWSHWHASIR